MNKKSVVDILLSSFFKIETELFHSIFAGAQQHYGVPLIDKRMALWSIDRSNWKITLFDSKKKFKEKLPQEFNILKSEVFPIYNHSNIYLVIVTNGLHNFGIILNKENEILSNLKTEK